MSKSIEKKFWFITVFVLLVAFFVGFIAIEYTTHNTAPPQQSDKIGGGFQLISPAGSIVNDGTFRGRWILMYFGATRCPYNQCQKDLVKMGDIINLLKNENRKIVPIFISFDIDYDTPDRLMLSMKPLNNKIIALTGGTLALRDISILYHVPIHKTKLPNGLELIQPYDQFILMNPDGTYNQSIPLHETSEQIAKQLENIIQ